MMLQYGRIVTDKVLVNYEEVKTITKCTETVKVKDDKDILAAFLVLLDQYKAGEIDLPGIQVLRDPKNNSLRVEKTWTVLH